MNKEKYTYADNAKLCEKWKAGDKEAGERLCILNNGLVAQTAARFAEKYGLDLYDDLYQEGMIGMLEAAKKYDSAQGSFSTYAVWYIRQRILRFVYDKTRNVRIPSNVVMMINRCAKADSMHQDLDYYDRIRTIASDVNISEKKVEWLLGLQYRFRHSKSLDVPMGEDSELTLKDFIPEENANGIEAMVHDGVQKEYAEKLFFCKRLTDRERRILAMRNGFVTGNEMTLEAVGKEVGVTRERIRQIEAKAYRKLRREILCNKELKVEDYSGELLADA